MSTQESETKEIHFAGGAAPAGGLHAEAATALRVQRFFTKLFQEAFAMGATQVSFMDGEELRIGFQQGKQSLKTVTIGSHWRNQLLAWLAQRKSFIRAGERAGAAPKADSPFDWDFPIDAALTDLFVRARVKVVQKLSKCVEIVLSEPRAVRWEEVVEQFSLSARNAELISAAARNPVGLIVVAGPSVQALPGAVASLSAMVEGAYLGSLAACTDRDGLFEIATRQRVLVDTVGRDPADIIAWLLKGGWPVERLAALTIAVQGFARRVCPGCSRPGVLEASVRDGLPQAFHPAADSNYRIGHGCGACGHAGYDGLVAYQTVVALHQDELRALQALPVKSEERIIRLLSPARIRPLLEDGTEKGYRGLLTLNDVLSDVRAVHHEYFRHRERTGAEPESAAIEIDQDFFFHPNGETASRPLQGRGAFTGKEEDAPLFQFNRGGPARERPLLLVVEDDPDQRSILEMVLKGAQYDVLIAGDGMEALECLGRETPDLIVTDLMMPRLDGRGLVAKLKAHSVHSKIPVLVLTVLDDSDQEYALLDLGVDDYCEKNIQRKILLKRIENVLRRAGVVRNAVLASS